MHSASILALAAAMFAQVGAPSASEILTCTDPYQVSLGPIPGDDLNPDDLRIAWPLVEAAEREGTRLAPLTRSGARKYLAQRRSEFAAGLKSPEYEKRNRTQRRALSRRVRLAAA